MALVADLLTFSRLFIAVAVVLLGLFYGERVFRGVVLLLLAGWSTDILDGKLARMAKGHTMLGGFDFLLDLLMVVSSFIYLSLSGFVSGRLALIYLFALTLVFVMFHSKSVLMLLIAPLTFLPFFIAYQHDHAVFLIACVWALIAFCFERKRFFGVIAEFAAGFPGGYLKNTARFFERLSRL